VLASRWPLAFLCTKVQQNELPREEVLNFVTHSTAEISLACPAARCPAHDQESTEWIESDGDVAVLVGMRIVDRDRVGIVKYADGIGVCDLMLGPVALRFSGIPLKSQTQLYAHACVQSRRSI